MGKLGPSSFFNFATGNTAEQWIGGQPFMKIDLHWILEPIPPSFRLMFLINMKFTWEEITSYWIHTEVCLLLSPILSSSKQGFGLCLIQRLAWIMADFRGMYSTFAYVSCIVTTPFNNTRTLKFKTQLTIAFYMDPENRNKQNGSKSTRGVTILASCYGNGSYNTMQYFNWHSPTGLFSDNKITVKITI